MPPIPITVPVLRVPLVLSLVLSEFLLGEGVPPVQGQGTGAPQSRYGECGCPQSRSVWGEGVSSNSVWVWGVEYTPNQGPGRGVGVPQSEKWGYASSGPRGVPSVQVSHRTGYAADGTSSAGHEERRSFIVLIFTFNRAVSRTGDLSVHCGVCALVRSFAWLCGLLQNFSDFEISLDFKNSQTQDVFQAILNKFDFWKPLFPKWDNTRFCLIQIQTFFFHQKKTRHNSKGLEPKFITGDSQQMTFSKKKIRQKESKFIQFLQYVSQSAF